MVLGNLLSGAAGGATVAIVIKAVDQFSGVFKLANKSLLGVGAAVTAVGIAGAGLIGGLIKVAGEFEQTNIAFTTMLGSAEKAKTVLKDLADFATKTPFTIRDVEQNSKLLLAMGIEVDDLLPTMKSLGDVSAGLSVPLERLALNFGQVKAQGKLTGRELRDFAIAGVPLVAELAKNLNVAESEIASMVSAGDIGFAEVEHAFQTMSGEGGIFFNLMDKQSKTFSGQVSNIQDSLIKVARVMGDVFLPAARWVAEQLAILVSWFEQHPKLATFTAILLGVVTALALIIGPLLIILALLPAMIAGFGTLSAVTLPITVTILAIAAAIAALIAIFVWWDEIIVYSTKGILWAAGIWDKTWEWVKDMFVIGWAYIKNAAISGWNFLIDVYQKGMEKIVNFLTPIFNIINSASRKLGFGNLVDVKELHTQIKAMDSLKGTMTDIGALESKLKSEREQRADAFESISNSIYEQIKAQRLGTEETEKQVDAVNQQNAALSKQQQLVKDLSGYKVLVSRDAKTGELSYGDVFKAGGFSSSEFESRDAYEQARRGAGMTINIDNVNGLDPDEIAAALNEKLKDIMTI